MSNQLSHGRRAGPRHSLRRRSIEAQARRTDRAAAGCCASCTPNAKISSAGMDGTKRLNLRYRDRSKRRPVRRCDGGPLTKFGNWTIEIVKRTADAAGFQLLPRRWVVERTLAWLNRNRRLAKHIASVQLLVRRLGCA